MWLGLGVAPEELKKGCWQALGAHAELGICGGRVRTGLTSENQRMKNATPPGWPSLSPNSAARLRTIGMI